MQNSSRNVRRFFRINMPVRYFVTPSSPIRNREIFATGADYLPATVKHEIEQAKHAIFDQVSRLKESKEVLTEIFNEIIEHIDYFRQCCEQISLGHNPSHDPSYWYTADAYRKGLPKLRLLEKSAPKTFAYLKRIEEKFIYFFTTLVECVTHSNADHFHTPTRNLKSTFPFDKLIEQMSDEKYDKIPLVQAIKAAGHYLDINVGIFRAIYEDNSLRQHPESWPEEIVNISASGIAVNLRKGIKMHERIDIRLYFYDYDRVIKFDGVVVNLQADRGQDSVRVAMNFEFPDGKDQSFLLTEIQKYEIQECIDMKPQTTKASDDAWN